MTLDTYFGNMALKKKKKWNKIFNPSWLSNILKSTLRLVRDTVRLWKKNGEFNFAANAHQTPDFDKTLKRPLLKDWCVTPSHI